MYMYLYSTGAFGTAHIAKIICDIIVYLIFMTFCGF